MTQIVAEQGRVNLIILAGDRGAGDPLAGALGVARKALLPIADQPMVCHVLRAALNAANVDHIYVVANDVASIKAGLPEQPNEKTHFVEGASTPVMTVQEVLQDMALPAVLITADNPLLTGPALDAFIQQSRDTDGDMTVAFAAKSDVLREFPDASRTFIKLGVEGYTGCNMFYFNRDTVFNVLGFWRQVERERKKAIKLIAAFGVWNLMKVLLGFTDITRAMQDASRVLKADVRAIIVSDPALSMDVDKPAHIPQVEAVLRSRS